KPASFRSPTDAVTSFLDALKAKDLQRLAEATALRAPTEAAVKNQKMFEQIREESLSEDALADFASKLEGYQIAGENQAKSSGKLGVILSNNKDGDTYLRTVTVRKEKAGWKVLDVSGAGIIDRPNMKGRIRNR
ncbi:DUF4878 domain-containing protein, partial [Singulisphaera rosea]